MALGAIAALWRGPVLAKGLPQNIVRSAGKVMTHKPAPKGAVRGKPLRGARLTAEQGVAQGSCQRRWVQATLIENPKNDALTQANEGYDFQVDLRAVRRTDIF